MHKLIVRARCTEIPKAVELLITELPQRLTVVIAVTNRTVVTRLRAMARIMDEVEIPIVAQAEIPHRTIARVIHRNAQVAKVIALAGTILQVQVLQVVHLLRGTVLHGVVKYNHQY